MHPFVISEFLTEYSWVFYENGEERKPYLKAAQISIVTQKHFTDGSSVEKWLSSWSDWSPWTHCLPKTTSLD